MTNEWLEVSLGDLFKVKHGFAFKGEYFTDEATHTVLVTPGNFAIGGGFQDGKRKYYSGPVPDEYILSPGQVVVTMTDLSKQADTLGYAARIPRDGITWLHNQRIGLLKFNANIPSEPRFVEYLLRTHGYRSWIVGSATGTTVKHTSPSRIETYRVSVPPRETQRAIATTLGALDDKIELNRQINSTLESMSQALFKSWFVDFDPVIDNALKAGNPIPESLQARAEARKALGDQRKALPEDVRKQFPSSFVFTEEMGWIPNTWSISTLGMNELEIESGRRPSGGIDKTLVTGVPSVGAESIAPIGEFNYSSMKLVPEEFAASANKGWVKKFDVALYKDGGKPGEFRPRVTLYGNGFPYESFMVNEHVFLLRSKPLGQGFLFYLLTSKDALHQLITRGSAKAAQPGINQSDVKDIRFVLPDIQCRKLFKEFVNGSVEKRLTLGVSNKTLSSIRDALLPRLLSGQLRIPEADKQVAEAI